MSGWTFPFSLQELDTFLSTTTLLHHRNYRLPPRTLTMYPDTFEGFAIPAANQWQKTQRIEVRCSAPELLSPP